MILLDQILACARAEVRSAGRLVRTWLFIIVALLSGIGAYGVQIFLHTLGSSASATVGAVMSPRFLIVQSGLQMLAVLMLALTFLAFDIRARDRRERMHEVLDTRAIDNFTALFGRLLGLVLVGWLPLLAIVLFALGLTALADAAGWWIKPGIEPRSTLALLLVDGPVTLALWGAIVMFLAIVVRNRLAVAIIALAILGGYSFASLQTPVYLVGIFQPMGNMTVFPSDIAPVFLSWPSVVQRLCYAAIAVGLLAFAAVLHPRPDSGGRAGRLAVGAALTILGTGGIANLALSFIDDRQQRDAWARTHEAATNAPRADLESLAASVVIDPGNGLAIEVDATLRAPSGSEPLVFTLNPGMGISELLINDERADFTHDAGLLTITRTAVLPPDAPFTLSLRAVGLPDPGFAYLDAAFDPLALPAAEAGALLLLGATPALFHDDYVALMPGIRWLPMPGALVGLDDPDRGRDFFTLNLEVEVPRGWLAAAPGRRHPVAEDEDTTRVRFDPGAPVTEFGVFAAPFERFATEIHGVALELLVSPQHAGNLRFFADGAEELHSRLANLLDEATRLGLPYPYDGFSVVEVPMGLRSYGGGWRMDTALALPGVMLLPEAGVPLAEFGFALRDADRFAGKEGGLPKAKIKLLLDSLENDFGGGNPFVGISRSFFTYQTGAAGDGAVALDTMLAHLANRLITNREGYFSAHGLPAKITEAVGRTVSTLVVDAPNVMANAIHNATTSRPAVWDRALGQAVADLDVHTDPELAVGALALKTEAVSRTLLESLGRERASALLAELRRRYSGENFTAEDFAALASELGADLHPIVGDWLFETAMPGYLVSEVRGYRLSDSDTGEPRYQLLVDVRNDEPAPGSLWLTGEMAPPHNRRGSGPLRIPGNTSMEVGMVTAAQPLTVRLGFHLALNRRPLLLSLPTIDDEDAVDAEPFNGSRPSDWRPRQAAGIVIDDLDPRFSVDYDDGAGGPTGGLAFALGALPSPDMDEGLPQRSPVTSSGGQWSRQVHAGAWGKYRRTFARAGITRANARAVFAAELPHEGQWRLEYHLPRQGPSRSSSFSGPGIRLEVNEGEPTTGDQGVYDIVLVMGDDRQSIEFDGSVAQPGWNRLGQYDVTDRHVEVVVANRADAGNTVVADAVRWTPIASSGP